MKPGRILVLSCVALLCSCAGEEAPPGGGGSPIGDVGAIIGGDAAPEDSGGDAGASPDGLATVDASTDGLADTTAPDAQPDATTEPDVTPGDSAGPDGTDGGSMPDGTDTPDTTPHDTTEPADTVDTTEPTDTTDPADTTEPTDTVDTTPTDSNTPEDTTPTDSSTPEDTGPEPVATINEVACTGGDFIEIIADSDMDLAGFILSDAPGDPEHTYVLPSLVAGPETLAVVAVATEESPGLPFGIKCGSDTVWLMRPDGTVADSVAVPDLPAGATWGRLPDGTGPFLETKVTKGAPNQPWEDLVAKLYDPLSVAQVDVWLGEEGLAALWQDPYTYVDGKVRITVGDYTSPPLDVGVRIKGRIGSYRDLNGKSALKLKFNHKVKGTTFLGLERMTLNNMVQDSSMLHESVAYTLLRELVPASRTGYAWVRLNNRDYGLYLNLETYDDVFMASHFETTQHIFEGSYGLDVTPGAAAQFDLDEGPADDLADLEALIAVANLPAGDAFWGALPEVADVDEMLRLWAAEIWIGHWDGYAPTINNYYLHSDDTGRFSMMTSGADQTFGSHLDWHSGKGRLFKRCMETPDCREAYDQTMAEMLQVIAALDLGARVKEIAAAIHPWVVADPRRSYSLASHTSAIEKTIAFIAKRQADATSTFGCLLGADPDPDGDGHPCASDCDNNDPAVHPGAQDTCGDGKDQDCSGVADDAPGCPDWTELWLGATRYLVCTTPRSWHGARAHCQTAGTDLVVLETAAEQAWLRANSPAVASDTHWIGLSDTATEGQFLWVDGAVPGFWGFGPGEPNDWGGGEDCTELLSNGAWNDMPCETTRRVICEQACVPGWDSDGDGADACGEDCDDNDPAVHPGAVDICLDGKDQDCSGVPDDGPGCVPGCIGLPGLSYEAVVCVTKLPWPDARAQCVLMGGDLATFANKAEQDAAVQAIAAVAPGLPDAWIGLGDAAAEGAYYWVDGTKPTYTSWAPGQPSNNGDQDCVRMYADGQWNDTACSETHGRVCRLPTVNKLIGEPGCTPICEGKDCGDDGCGGSCGACDEGVTCTGGVCGGALPSCEGACGEQSPAGCWCDDSCADYGDCCPDHAELCAPSAPDDSCVDACGGQAPAGCWCDAQCTSYGDCCEDFKDACASGNQSCNGYCDKMSPGGCYCDAVCGELHDCCPDKGTTCGGCSCEGKVCGDDGCGGTCGHCPLGTLCDGGACVAPGDTTGCEADGEPGCGGCACEACVCDADIFCCYIAWDSACAEACCGGCGP